MALYVQYTVVHHLRDQARRRIDRAKLAHRRRITSSANLKRLRLGSFSGPPNRDSSLTGSPSLLYRLAFGHAGGPDRTRKSFLAK